MIIPSSLQLIPQCIYLCRLNSTSTLRSNGIALTHAKTKRWRGKLSAEFLLNSIILKQRNPDPEFVIIAWLVEMWQPLFQNNETAEQWQILQKKNYSKWHVLLNSKAPLIFDYNNYNNNNNINNKNNCFERQVVCYLGIKLPVMTGYRLSNWKKCSQTNRQTIHFTSL